MMKSNLLRSLAFAALLFASFAAHANETTVDTPNLHVYTNGAGTSVVAPGINVQTPGSVTVTSAAKNTTSTTATASYVNANMPNMDFSNQKLAGVDFSNAVLTGSNFSGTDLTGANLTNANLANANLTGATLVKAQLVNAVLTEANLTNADFSGADLTNATVVGATATGTRFTKAVLTNVDMGSMHAQTAARPDFVEASSIRTALKTDPAHPSEQRRIDLTVNFDFNSDKLTPDGAKQVREIAAALKDSDLQTSRILVEGHTDAVGTDDYNQKLSEQRALRVLHTLEKEYKVSSAKLSAQGFGKTQPIASNDSDLGRATNRRVALVNLGDN